MKKKSIEPKRPMGVYRLSIAHHDKVYLGSSVNLPALINRHRAELEFGTHRLADWQHAWNTSGEGAFAFAVLDVLERKEDAVTDPVDDLAVLLDLWIHKLRNEGATVVTL